ncbi:hypothetical protein H9657_12585 [Cellulomonas sp. Sa3CUA2]|uniref:Rhamnan synthesis protein F n=1 Tax=Cellulomonas avistercoris TaxID=2762242 RepID=A0ABR8QF98_9CELL|nr:rhamnan synthesis F family protein [Cellulomonas avistercoris]MBD7919107.1 hypothetical protein [Cellulomonas avistercoris]
MILAADNRERRLVVYFFYDEQGVVDDYVIHMLEHVQACASDILVVCNGRLTPEGRARLRSVDGVEVLVRENVGFDVWAYRTALEHVGWDALAEYDEVVLMNFTVMGPVNDLGEMFDEMAGRDLDFWGITVHNGAPFDPWGNMPEGEIPLHLQSHFIAVRRSMLAGPEFRRYWDEMVPIDTYIDAVSKHEALFTQRFERMGYSWAAYVDTSDMNDRLFYPLFNEPVELIENRRCPVFKRKTFFAGAGAYLSENSGRPPAELFEYLRESKRYPEELLVQHLLRSSDQFDLDSSLNLNFVLPTSGETTTSQAARHVVVVEAPSVARLREVLHGYDGADLDLLIVADPAAGADDACASVVAARSLRAEVVPGRTWLAAADRLAAWDVVTVLGLPGGESTFPHSNADAFDRDQREWTLAGAAHRAAVLDLFGRAQFLGLLVPPRPMHSGYYGALGHEWDDTFDLVRTWSRDLGLSVAEKLKEQKPPVAPAGNAFSFRRQALDTLLVAVREGTLTVDDEPDERRREAALRMLLPLVAQSSGFASARAITDRGVGRYLGTALHYLRELNGVLGQGGTESFSQLTHRLTVTSQVTGVMPGVENATYGVYWGRGAGYWEHDGDRRAYHASPQERRDFVATFEVPAGVQTIRFDPIEGVSCVCRDVRVDADVPLTIRPVNAVTLDGWDFFATTDPQYEITGDLSRVTSVRVTLGEFHTLAASSTVLGELLRVARSGQRGPMTVRSVARGLRRRLVARSPLRRHRHDVGTGAGVAG